MSHSPEPWWVDDDGFIASGTGTEHVTVADPRMMPPGDDLMDDNAQRIVACVNACKGIDTELLEPKMLGNQIAAKMHALERGQTLAQDLEDLLAFMGTVRDKLYNAESMSMDERRDLARLIEARLP